MPAHMTAKMVMASAKRAMALRHALAEEEEDGRDQRAGVADADPEDEVDDVEGPEDGAVVAPDADARVEGVADAAEAQ